MSTWSAPVRYGELDGQGIVFNANYLLYADEAMSAFCRERGILEVAERVRVVKSTLLWTASATWGDVVDVDVSCDRIGTTSFTLRFAIGVGERPCCAVETVYVLLDESGRPTPLPAELRAGLMPG